MKKLCLDRIPACDRQIGRHTDGRTSCHGIVRAMHARCAVKTTVTAALSKNRLNTQIKHVTDELVTHKKRTNATKGKL